MSMNDEKREWVPQTAGTFYALLLSLALSQMIYRDGGAIQIGFQLEPRQLDIVLYTLLSYFAIRLFYSTLAGRDVLWRYPGMFPVEVLIAVAVLATICGILGGSLVVALGAFATLLALESLIDLLNGRLCFKNGFKSLEAGGAAGLAVLYFSFVLLFRFITAPALLLLGYLFFVQDANAFSQAVGISSIIIMCNCALSAGFLVVSSISNLSVERPDSPARGAPGGS